MNINPISFNGNNPLIRVTTLGDSELYLNKDKVVSLQTSNKGNYTQVLMENDYTYDLKGMPSENALLFNNEQNNNGKNLNITG